MNIGIPQDRGVAFRGILGIENQAATTRGQTGQHANDTRGHVRQQHCDGLARRDPRGDFLGQPQSRPPNLGIGQLRNAVGQCRSAGMLCRNDVEQRMDRSLDEID